MSDSGDRLYQLLPMVYRARDAENGYALKALLAVMEQQLNVVEGDVDQLYRNWFIETCQEWLVPYLGDLMAVRGVQAYGSGNFTLRAYVANTLAYRRRKGTAAVLEQLARDVTGWRARVVEFFQLLETTQYINHIRLQNHRTPDIRDSNCMAYVDGPFDEVAHTGEVRRIASQHGKYNIPNIGIYLWRLQSYYINGVVAQPHTAGDGRFYFNPLGADLVLFNRPQTETDIAHLAEEINVPAALRRRALYDDVEGLRSGMTGSGRYFAQQPVLEVVVDGMAVLREDIYICDLGEFDKGGVMDWRRPPASAGDHQTVAVDPVLGRLSFASGETPTRVEVSYCYGFSDDVGGGPYSRQQSINAWLPRWQQPEVADPAFELWQIGVTQDSSLHAAVDSHSPVVETLVEAIEAWNNFCATASNAFGIITILGNASYEEDLSTTEIAIPGGARLAVVAADWPDNDQMVDGVVQRPRGRLVPQNCRPHIKAEPVIRGTAAGGAKAGEVLFDGILLEGRIRVRPGDLGGLHILHSTLGADASGLSSCLQVETASSGAGTVTNNANLAVTLEHSIVGALSLPADITALTLLDSIVGDDRSAGGSTGSGGGLTTSVAIEALGADVVIARSTVFGTLGSRTLSAENSIFTGVVTIIRRQAGCLRFCYLPPGSRTPRRYRCQPDYALQQLAETLGLKSPADLAPSRIASVQARLRPDFTSTRYGEAAFAQLSGNCVEEVRTGADDGAEMGVFNTLKQPQREANLRAALDEYLRFGLEAGIFYVT